MQQWQQWQTQITQCLLLRHFATENEVIELLSFYVVYGYGIP